MALSKSFNFGRKYETIVEPYYMACAIYYDAS